MKLPTPAKIVVSGLLSVVSLERRHSDGNADGDVGAPGVRSQAGRARSARAKLHAPMCGRPVHAQPLRADPEGRMAW